MGQLDADPVGAEPVHQIGQRRRGRIRPAVGKRLADMAFAAAGQDVPVPARRLGQRVEVVARLALLAAGQMRRGQLPRQPSVTLRPAGQHQQVRARRIGLARCAAPGPATARRRTPCACRVPRRLRRTAPPRRARRGRSARWPADPAGPPPRPVPPACWPRRGSCTPNARAARRTGRTSEPAGLRPAADRRSRLRDQGASSAGVHTVGVPERRGLPVSTRSISDQPSGPLLHPID